jgi:hypothetical protein
MGYGAIFRCALFPQFRGVCGQGRGRTADLPLFRSTAPSAVRTWENPAHERANRRQAKCAAHTIAPLRTSAPAFYRRVSRRRVGGRHRLAGRLACLVALDEPVAMVELLSRALSTSRPYREHRTRARDVVFQAMAESLQAPRKSTFCGQSPIATSSRPTQSRSAERTSAPGWEKRRLTRCLVAVHESFGRAVLTKSAAITSCYEGNPALVRAPRSNSTCMPRGTFGQTRQPAALEFVGRHPGLDYRRARWLRGISMSATSRPAPRSITLGPDSKGAGP